jgi:hypothetical protein
MLHLACTLCVGGNVCNSSILQNNNSTHRDDAVIKRPSCLILLPNNISSVSRQREKSAWQI